MRCRRWSLVVLTILLMGGAVWLGPVPVASPVLGQKVYLPLIVR
jgi:hypothetical protein